MPSVLLSANKGSDYLFKLYNYSRVIFCKQKVVITQIAPFTNLKFVKEVIVNKTKEAEQENTPITNKVLRNAKLNKKST